MDMYLLVILIVGCDGLMQDAKEKFQSLQNVIAILGDPEKRKVYDETGSVDAAVCSLSLHTAMSLFKSEYCICIAHVQPEVFRCVLC